VLILVDGLYDLLLYELAGWYLYKCNSTGHTYIHTYRNADPAVTMVPGVAMKGATEPIFHVIRVAEI
jgi:hypothetical protein